MKNLTKPFNVRLPKDLWIRLKHYAADIGLSSNKIIIEQLDKILPKISRKSNKKSLKNKENK